jgi:hypothetical protein
MLFGFVFFRETTTLTQMELSDNDVGPRGATELGEALRYALGTWLPRILQRLTSIVCNLTFGQEKCFCHFDRPSQQPHS